MGALKNSGGVLFTALGILLCCPSQASHFSLDVGAYADNLAQRVNVPAGYASQVSTLTGLVRARPLFSIGHSLSFEPSFALLVPWRSGSDGFAKVITSFTSLDFGISPFSWLKWRLGTALQWNWTLTQPSAVDLNNGTSTSTFYLPGGTSSSFVLLVETGLEFHLTASLSFGVDVWVSQVANATRRRFNGMVYFGVQL